MVLTLIERIERLEQQYKELKAENQLLKEQLKKNSKNSLKPPSQDQGKGFKTKEKNGGSRNREVTLSWPWRRLWELVSND
ncbi:MAG: hypothetical protein HC825_05825 [Oscillatoriales cyanobacterium RM1_1_9]|nr:hypothetical protein [Oscillatoriales cyanobacterium RM1_1_9]